jgi:hypothetical protein
VSSSYILGLGGELCNRRLFARKPTNKRRSKKMTNTRSALLVNPTTRKISIRKTNKIQPRRSRISNQKLECVFEISKDPLNCRPMRRVWGSLKACTKTHGELNARSCHREVQEGADNALVLPLLNSLAIFI